jgi:sterol desaturase/sphingolipid hydroxylase (fatty acid hydroxylase superfamily)
MKIDWVNSSLIFLVVLTIISASDIKNKKIRISNVRRNLSDWLLDILSLSFQFVIIPILQFHLSAKLINWSIPQLKASISGNILTSLIAFLIVDYAWYWNHRLFHSKTKFWNFHVIHHEPKQLDFFVTSRGTLTSIFIKTYFWLFPIVIFLFDDSHIFLGISGLGLVLSFWTHTEFNFPANSFLEKVLGSILILPKDHFWHHSTYSSRTNFGNVLNIWDKLHGTWYVSESLPTEMGIATSMPLWKKLFFPF